jgi:predicted transcriptional regulator
MESTEPAPATDLETRVAEIVTSYLTKNQVAPTDLPTLITTVFESLKSLGAPREPEPPQPAVPIRQSVASRYVVCLECGWRGGVLKRHLGAMHGLSPDQYRSRWKLSREHPLTAPAYSERRSKFAKQIGLGQRMGRNRNNQTIEASGDPTDVTSE